MSGSLRKLGLVKSLTGFSEGFEISVSKVFEKAELSKIWLALLEFSVSRNGGCEIAYMLVKALIPQPPG